MGLTKYPTVGYSEDMPKRPAQTNVLLDEQAKKDARTIARRYGLNGVSAAIRFALRDMAHSIEQEGNPKRAASDES